MEEDDEEGAPSQGIGGVERGGLVDIFRQQVHPPAAAIAIGGLAVNMNVEGQRENFYGQTLQREGGAAESSAGGSVAAAAPMSLSPGAIEGLTFVSAAGSAQFTSAALARGGRDAQLQSKGKHGGNSLRLEASHCHQLSNPHVMTAYHKWAANQGTAKKASFWGFFEELKKAVGIYPPVWRCVGCHPSQDAALALYEQKKDLKIMPPGIVRYGSFLVRAHLYIVCQPAIERRMCVHWYARAHIHACIHAHIHACTHLSALPITDKRSPFSYINRWSSSSREYQEVD